MRRVTRPLVQLNAVKCNFICTKCFKWYWKRFISIWQACVRSKLHVVNCILERLQVNEPMEIKWRQLSDKGTLL
jgi:hypothetical protein